MVAFTPYGDQSRRQRRLMHAAFGASNVKRYHPLLELETKPFLRGLLEDPFKFQNHLRRCVGRLCYFFAAFSFFFFVCVAIGSEAYSLVTWLGTQAG